MIPSGSLVERSSVEDSIKRISDQFTGTRCKNKLLKGLHYTQMKRKEPANSLNSHFLDFSVKTVWGHFFL